MKRNLRKNKNHRWIKIFVSIVIVIIIIFSLLFVGIMLLIDGKLNKIQTEKITNDLNELGIEESNIDSEREKYRDILLLGIDADSFDTAYRTDCIMVANINKENDNVQLYSIYRDTYLEIEENGTKKLDKVNHAYYGGVENTIKAINTNLDLSITEYVIVDFGVVSNVVDAVGGIDIDIDSSEIKNINAHMISVSQATGKPVKNITKTGLQHLDGVQAVAYCRIRHTDGGDYKRTERMREVLQKVVDKIKSLSLPKINELLDLLLPELRTNLTTKDIKGFIPKVLSFNIKKEFGWPYNVKEVIINDDYFDPPVTLESNVKRLHQEVYGEINYEVPDRIKKISDKIIKETDVKEE